MASRHNILQSRLTTQYNDLPPRACFYCESRTDFPRGLVKKEASCVNPSGVSFRPDVSIWSNGALLATIEVIDTNLSDLALDAQTTIPNAFYFHVDGRFWCSPECWQWQHGRGPGSAEVNESRFNRKTEPLERVCALPQCEYCQRLFLETRYPAIQLVDWEAPSGPICIECAVQHLEGAQYKTPGKCMDGNTMPESSDDVLGNFLALSDAVFWAMVWHNRASEPNEAQNDESATARCLDDIENAFDEGEWEQGARLLSPIGAPAWSFDRDDERPLYAWDPDNCRRTAEAWIRLRAWRVTQLPVDLRELAQMPNLEPVPEKAMPQNVVDNPADEAATLSGQRERDSRERYDQEVEEWNRLNDWFHERLAQG